MTGVGTAFTTSAGEYLCSPSRPYLPRPPPISNTEFRHYPPSCPLDRFLLCSPAVGGEGGEGQGKGKGTIGDRDGVGWMRGGVVVKRSSRSATTLVVACAVTDGPVSEMPTTRELAAASPSPFRDRLTRTGFIQVSLITS